MLKQFLYGFSQPQSCGPIQCYFRPGASQVSGRKSIRWRKSLPLLPLPLPSLSFKEKTFFQHEKEEGPLSSARFANGGVGTIYYSRPSGIPLMSWKREKVEVLLRISIFFFFKAFSPTYYYSTLEVNPYLVYITKGGACVSLRWQPNPELVSPLSLPLRT